MWTNGVGELWFRTKHDLDNAVGLGFNPQPLECRVLGWKIVCHESTVARSSRRATAGVGIYNRLKWAKGIFGMRQLHIVIADLPASCVAGLSCSAACVFQCRSKPIRTTYQICSLTPKAKEQQGVESHNADIILPQERG